MYLIIYLFRMLSFFFLSYCLKLFVIYVFLLWRLSISELMTQTVFINYNLAGIHAALFKDFIMYTTYHGGFEIMALGVEIKRYVSL